MKHYPKSSNKSKSKTTSESVTITTTDTATTTSLSESEIEERLQVYRPEIRENIRNEIIQRMEDRRLEIEKESKRKE